MPLLYLAGGNTAWRRELEHHRLLVSFAQPKELRLLRSDWDIPGILLDSGAFSVWKSGSVIDLDKYIDFIKTWQHRLDGYFALDVIPASNRPEDVKRAVQGSLDNLQKMLDAGLEPIPVYHEGESLELLDFYVASGFEVIGLGATVSRGRPEITTWLDTIFARYPDQKFHGLAMTQARLLDGTYPFYSVDSTSWLTIAKYGLMKNLYLLKNRSTEFYRKLGIAALVDMVDYPRPRRRPKP